MRFLNRLKALFGSQVINTLVFTALDTAVARVLTREGLNELEKALIEAVMADLRTELNKELQNL